MSWTLDRPDGADLDVNAWNWRPTLALFEQNGLLDDEKLALLEYNVTVAITPDEARRIASFLDGYLGAVPLDGRVLVDGSVTSEPDDFQLHRDDLARNYSATAAWLRELRDFCRGAEEGFTVS
jgi:hypothetical protein